MAARKRQRRTSDSARTRTVAEHWAAMRRLDHSRPGTPAWSLPGTYRAPAEDNTQAGLLPARSQPQRGAPGQGCRGTSAALNM